MDVLRRKLPILVSLSSSGRKFPSASFASVIVLNLITENNLPYCPTLFWVKKGLFPVAKKTIKAMRARKGMPIRAPTIPTAISKTGLIHRMYIRNRIYVDSPKNVNGRNFWISLHQWKIFKQIERAKQSKQHETHLIEAHKFVNPFHRKIIHISVENSSRSLFFGG